LELILNKKLKSSDAVHHKDHDKLNNDFQNLKIIGNSEHISLHHAGSKKVGNFKPHNKLTEEKKIKITELSKKILKSNGKPHCSKIGEMLGISGFTVSRYI